MNLREQSGSGKIAALTTLYNSDYAVISNMATYISQVDKLYVVDNSQVQNKELVDQIIKNYPQVEYINNGGNKGIAYALNKGSISAIRDKYHYLLMMDDDSQASYNLVENLYRIYAENSHANIGIVAAQSDNTNRVDKHEVLTAITSGSLLNLNAYEDVGPFCDEFFIDWVDHEYSFRLRANNYKLILNNEAKFEHRLGKYKEKNLLKIFPLRWRSHSPDRIYYKFRNSLYTLYMYREKLPLSFIGFALKELIEDVFKIIFLEVEKKEYLSSVSRGVCDAYNSKMGMLDKS